MATNKETEHRGQKSGHTPGAVKNPGHDGRLKENSDTRTTKAAGGSHTPSRASTSGHTQGAVKDPEHDGRLKENREKGVHKGDDPDE